MATDVTLPALGESVEDGIVLAWLVEVGDSVDVDQPLLEISTDKIDTEIPSPVAGVVTEVRAEVDETINVGQVIVVIDETAAATPAAPAPADAPEAPAPEAPAPKPAAPAPAPAPAPKPAAPAPAPAPAASSLASNTGALVSPLTRKILREGGLSIDQVTGTGPGGRILREDAAAAVANGAAATGTRTVAQVRAAPTSERPAPAPVQIDFSAGADVTQDLSRVRKSIAKSMQASLANSAQLTAAVEVDVTRFMALRVQAKDNFKATYGASLSPFALVVRAAMLAIPRHPTVNSQIDVDSGTATWFKDVNLGVAVDAGEKGLIVPNVKGAQELTVAGLAQAIGDLAKRARSKGLKIEDIQGGTFTITNTGSLGTLFDTPILNLPEVAILATCAIEKRAKVITDEFGQDQIAIRWMTYLCLTYDHRQLDGADAARFLQDVKWVCENHDLSDEVA
ncbi:MAG: pyruvate dehydrogenase E2 component (dihydrolipoamide acetyltransferase) [Glaciecola sp.]|jgi:pyruvate dehydrogenase E2 component (dihydrolipoamide acetyltransferase)